MDALSQSCLASCTSECSTTELGVAPCTMGGRSYHRAMSRSLYHEWMLYHRAMSRLLHEWMLYHRARCSTLYHEWAVSPPARVNALGVAPCTWVDALSQLSRLLHEWMLYHGVHLAPCTMCAHFIMELHFPPYTVDALPWSCLAACTMSGCSTMELHFTPCTLLYHIAPLFLYPIYFYWRKKK